VLSQLLRDELKRYRRTLTRGQRVATYRRKFRMKYPHRVEQEIRAKISTKFSKYTKRIASFVKQHYPLPIVRHDNFETEFALFMKTLEADIKLELSDGLNLGPLFERILTFMLIFKEEEIAEYMKRLTGKNFYGTTEWWAETKRQWIDILDRSMSQNIENYVSNIRDVVYNAVRNKKTIDEVMADIMAANSSLDEKKAAFLARDMTGKLNGIIEKQLQLSVGIDGYLWQTMMDERVRGRPGGAYPDAIPSHWAMESKVCKWNDASIISFDFGRTWVPRSANMPYKHPGEDWLCRCSGAPFSISLLKDIDNEIAREEGRV
jgi:uncharacterized protein with gpF-like domain